MEKYQERVIKDLIEFKTELESDNQAEVEIIEKSLHICGRIASDDIQPILSLHAICHQSKYSK
jgi:hypothetical protein